MSDSITFEQRRAVALDILTRGERLTRRSGSFLGQLICDPTPMSDAQSSWFEKLCERAEINLEGLTHA